jgi:polysaccharide chain length determinant protein (PEP-CTERM system associated)
MQPSENFHVPRRPLDVEDYIDIVRRHKGWIFGPFLLTVVAGVVGVYLWPDSYESQAAIRIVPQQVPQTMVPPAVNQEMMDRINSMSQQIRSRTVLTTIINTFGLYPRERSRYPIEDVIEQMNKKIEVLPIGNAGGQGRQIPAFAIKFSYENRYLAQRVVQDLVTRFIDENTRSRSNASYQTTQFLKDQTELAKKELDEIEAKLTEFRMQNHGRLPDQVTSNMQQLQALQATVTYLANAMSRSEQEKLQLESSIRIYRDTMTALTKEQPELALAQQKNERLVEVEREIQQWENMLSVLRKQYKDSFPDVQTAVNRLAVAKQRRETILREEAESKKDAPAGPPPLNPQTQRELRDLDANIRRAQSTIEAKDLEMAEFTQQMKRANEQIKAYQARIETVPLGERQYGDLLRERDLARDKYIKLDETLSRAQIAQEMEGRKQGETLELLDSATLPINPTEPKRPLIVSIGAGVGLLLGVVIAGAREMKDTSLKNLKDVRAYTQMAILGSIPLLENDFVVRRRRRLAWLGWTTACLASAVVMAGSVVYYYVTRI